LLANNEVQRHKTSKIELDKLRAVIACDRQGVVTSRQQITIAKFLGTAPGWRPARIDELMLMFSNRAWCQAKKNKEELDEIVNEMGGEANVDVLWRELLRLLEEEIAAVRAAFEEEMKVQEEKDAIERDACLAPAGETWEMLLRQEAALDRSIDRKVRIILALRQEHARLCRGGSRTARTGTPWRAPTQEASPPGNEQDDRAAEELSKVVGPDAGTESQAEENPGETSKSPEQSQDVIENKAPAAEGVSV